MFDIFLIIDIIVSVISAQSIGDLINEAARTPIKIITGIVIFFILFAIKDSSNDNVFIKEAKIGTYISTTALFISYLLSKTGNKNIYISILLLTIAFLVPGIIRRNECKKINYYEKPEGNDMALLIMATYIRYMLTLFILNTLPIIGVFAIDAILTGIIFAKIKATKPVNFENEYKTNEERKYFHEGEPVYNNIAGYVYFEGCKTLEEVKDRYKQLSKAFHPDSRSGNEESFVKMQNEYDSICKTIGNCR